MKKLLLLFLFLLFAQQGYCANFSNETKTIYQSMNPYSASGIIYSHKTYPGSVANNINNNARACTNIDLTQFKRGESKKTNILGLVELGDASIRKAANDASIKEIHCVEHERGSVEIPFFIPISFAADKTVVYGR